LTFKWHIPVLIIFTALAVTGCFRNDSVRPENTNLNFVNVVSGESFSISINGSQLVSALAYGDSTKTASGAPGLYQIEITPANTTNAWINGTLSLQSGAYGSMYLIPDSNSTAANSSNRAYYTIISNIAPILPDTAVMKYANVRFFHFSPDSLPVNITFVRLIGGIPSVLPQDTLYLFKNRSFNDQSVNSNVSVFSTIPATNQYYKVVFTNAAIYPPTILYSIPQVHFADFGTYTLYVMGYRGATGAKALKTVNFPTQ
jgi:hypothetical protein